MGSRKTKGPAGTSREPFDVSATAKQQSSVSTALSVAVELIAAQLEREACAAKAGPEDRFGAGLAAAKDDAAMRLRATLKGGE